MNDETTPSDQDLSLEDAVRASANMQFGDEDQEDVIVEETDAKTAERHEVSSDEEEGRDAKETEGKDEGGDRPANEETDYLEFTDDDGQAQRVSLDDVWAGYNRAEALAAELAEARSTSDRMPAANQEALAQTFQARQQVMEQIRHWQAVNEPLTPDVRLLDPNKPQYDPESYAHQMRLNEELAQRNEEANKQLQQQQERADEERQALLNAYRSQEEAALKEFWPEIIANEATRLEFYKQMEGSYGLKAEDIANIYDHRLFKLAKDALAFKESQQKAKEAVKIVRSKPKLVRSRAKDSNSKKARQASAAAFLAEHGDSEAAALQALDAFFD